MKTHAFWRGRKTGEVTAAGPIDGAAAGRAVPAAPALRRDEGGEMATSEVTWESLREFAAFRAESPRALSVYIGLDPRTAATAGDPASRLSALLASGKHLAADEALDEFERAAVRTDIERVATFFAGELEREGVRGVAVFASSLDDVFEPVAVNGLVPDEIRLDNVFHLAPLVPLAEAEQALVAVVGREQGQIYRLAAGRLDELADRSEEQPGRHDQGGWSQKRFQRRIDASAREHLRVVAEELARQERRLRPVAIVVVGADETRAEFLDLLPGEARGSVVGGARMEAHAAPIELLELATSVLGAGRAAREQAALSLWREQAGPGRRAVTGWRDTLEAASDGRVELLLLEQGVRRPAFQCPACGRVAAREGACPQDGEALRRHDDGAGLAAHRTLLRGGTILTVIEHRDLEPAGGIAALLRY